MQTCADQGLHLSYMDVQFTYDKVGTRRPTDRAFQFVAQHGVVYATTTDCGDTPHPFRTRPHFEYFTLPARDLIYDPMCTEQRLEVERRALVAILDLDDVEKELGKSLPPIDPGEGVRVLRIGSDLTLQQVQQARDLVDDCVAIRWSMRHEYDGCNRPPTLLTHCGCYHCVSLTYSDSKRTAQVLEYCSND